MKMNKLKKFLAVTSALLICSGTMAYMPQDTFTNANINTAYAAEESVAINETNFPDEIFRQFVAENFDKDGDGVFSVTEIEAVKKIEVENKSISDLTGLKYFTSLEYLYCSSNQLAALDVSNNTALTELYCDDNQLTSLDVSNNTALTTLSCCYNEIISLDVSKNIELINLYCIWNHLTTLDVSSNTALNYLYCGSNQISALDVSKNVELETLRCNSNQLTTLDISKNTALEWLECFNNQLTALDVSKNTALTNLYCNSNQLTSLDVSNNTELTELYCYDNTYKIALTDGKFDLSTLPAGFDLTKASEWTNGSVEGNILTVEETSKNVTYTYDCGNEKTASFTLVPNVKQNSLLGDINNDSSIDSSDATLILSDYAELAVGKESSFNAEQAKAADVNGDGKYDSIDASLILAYYAHISTGGTGTIEDYLKS